MRPLPKPPACILVTGSGGFVGTAVVRRLSADGYHVRAMVRQPGAGLQDNVRTLIADMRDAHAIAGAVEGTDAVVHLAARKNDEPDSEAVNVGGAERLIEACGRHGVARVINVSTLAATFKRRSIYGLTKAAADERFSRSGLAVTTMLPSLVWGDDETGAFGKLVSWIERFTVVPVIGTGRALFQPIFVDDLAQAIVASIERAGSVGKVYRLGGPDTVTFDELVDTIATNAGGRKLKIHIPWHVAFAIAHGTRRIMRHPPVSVSNVLGLWEPNTGEFDLRPMIDELGVRPIGLRDGLRALLH